MALKISFVCLCACLIKGTSTWILRPRRAYIQNFFSIIVILSSLTISRPFLFRFSSCLLSSILLHELSVSILFLTNNFSSFSVLALRAKLEASAQLSLVAPVGHSYPSISLAIYLLIHQWLDPWSVPSSVKPTSYFILPPASQLVRESFSPFYIYIHASVKPSNHTSVSLFFCMCFSVSLFVCMCFSVSLFLCLCFSVSLLVFMYFSVSLLLPRIHSSWFFRLVICEVSTPCSQS